KGKTTAAVGLAVRSVGTGHRVLFVQFFKEDSAVSGEKEVFGSMGDKIELLRSNCRHPIFTKDKTDEAAVKRAVTETFKEAREKIAGTKVDLLVLDEVLSAVNGNWITLEEIIKFLDERPEHTEVVMTGRDAPPELVRIADYVTEMLKIKHPFDFGTKARKGIEF
ncbi:MAG: cob(I)yrinic acid a,c-diamide adenosyltransferase, partial [Nitrospirota bacterium]|nr:cob(I)yrinic acid a,c-diamide adenosyltransferase [Nitrospirota bacterium]